MLATNALWLCNLRWGAIAMLMTFGVTGLFTDSIEAFGLLFRSDWSLVMAGVLIVANVAFAAIHANTQLLLKGHCGPMTDEAHESLLDIASGSRRLLHGIKQTLQLASLRSAPGALRTPVELALDDVVRASVAQVRPTADERKVVIEEHLQPVRIHFDEEHLKALLKKSGSGSGAHEDEGRE